MTEREPDGEPPNQPGSPQPSDAWTEPYSGPPASYHPTTPLGPPGWQPGPPPGSPDWPPPSGGWDWAPSAGGWEPPKPPPGRRHGLVWALIAAAVVVIVAIALINVNRSHGNSTATGGGPSAQQTMTPPLVPGPTASAPSSGGSGGSGGSLVPRVSCPQIRDEESHLAYRCIDNYLQQSAPDGNLGIRISLNHLVEPNWVISEGSGNPASFASPPSGGTIRFTPGGRVSAARPIAVTRPVSTPTLDEVRQEVRRRAALALAVAYGDGPSATIAGERTRTFSGVTGYQLQIDITINPAFRAATKLKTTSERLWVVGVPTVAGVSIFMLSIPNARSDLWSKADATIGSITVI